MPTVRREQIYGKEHFVCLLCDVWETWDEESMLHHLVAHGAQWQEEPALSPETST